MDVKISIISMLIFNIITFLFSLKDNSAEDVRMRFLIGTIMYFVAIVIIYSNS